MTTDTSREAVEALIETVRNKYGAFDHFHRELADAAAALLDERDGLREDRQMQRESLHHAVERISDLEATNRKIIERSANHHDNAIKWRDRAERAEAERDRLQAAYNKRGDDLVIAYTQRDIARAERDKLAAKLDAVKAYDEELFRVVDRFTSGQETMFPLIEAVERWRHADRAILADTDEGNESNG